MKYTEQSDDCFCAVLPGVLLTLPWWGERVGKVGIPFQVQVTERSVDRKERRMLLRAHGFHSCRGCFPSLLTSAE